MEESGFNENMTVPVGNQGQNNRFGFMLGAFNDGIRLVLKGRRLFHFSDEILIKFQRALINKYEIDFEHSRNFVYHHNLYNISFGYQQSFKYAKFVAYEKSVSLTLKDLTNYPDWSLRLAGENRKNIFDSASCVDYFKQHSLPSNKISLSLNYNKIKINDIFQLNWELAVTPKNRAKFIKIEHDRAHSWTKNKVKFVNYYRMGYLFPLTNDIVYINDRFFTYHNIGYSSIGHNQPPAQPILNLKANQEVMHDDLGSHKYLTNQFRIEFSNLPGLRALDLKAMWYFDAIYYPQEKTDNNGVLESLMNYTRFSHGIGLNYAISPVMNISLYYNIGNFNVRKGDDALLGCISLTFLLL